MNPTHNNTPYEDIIEARGLCVDKIAQAKLKIEEAGMIPKVIYPVGRNTDGSATVRVVVDIEATITSQQASASKWFGKPDWLKW